MQLMFRQFFQLGATQSKKGAISSDDETIDRAAALVWATSQDDAVSLVAR